ncbi:acyloxyacyl hydrolase [Loktanella sp. IMCC34160]|uniref:acyloxyacyl hydrolase n=1 Tax=Loktanella sp. IMCC34160 TaxID=2510646 RepID=UPI00101DDA69|nr:acyloxyacyl hydrolase [Loktanella sp. IMCC34160]RYG89757.1 acyloxyacyl hydrolase [Loktanella sp. IMCC34160]
MADGTFAVLLLAFGLTDMAQNHCGTDAGCLAGNDRQARFAISAGEVLERRAQPAGEIYLRYDFGRGFGPFGTAAGLSVGEKGELWMGYGVTYELTRPDTPYFAELHLMPGLYAPNDGFDLGGPLEFRSGIEFGYETRSGVRFGLAYDHRSNADIFAQNPGIETVQLRVSFPM